MMENVLLILGVIVLIVAAYFLSAFILMWAWNIAVASVFHLPHINLLQAFAFTLLIWIIKPTISATKK